MIKKILSFSVLLMVGGYLSAQDSKAILNDFTAKLNSYKSVDISFSFITEDTSDRASDTKEGRVQQKAKSFKVTMDDVKVYSDGVTKWTILEEAEEITLQEVDTDSNSMLDNPIGFLSVSNKELNSKYKGEVMLEGKQLYEIDFHPKDKNAAYSKVALLIEKNTLYPFQVKYVGKDGTSYTVKIKQFKPNASIADSELVFNKGSYKGYEVVDLR